MKIKHLVNLRKILRWWMCRMAVSSPRKAQSLPPDVPAGHVALHAGDRSKRFVVPAAQLNHPAFQELLLLAEEEFGFANAGPLTLPCDEAAVEDALRCAKSATFREREEIMMTGSCHVGLEMTCQAEARPLLGSFGG